MKAVIVDISKNDAVILRDDGQFEKVKNKNYFIGQEILLQPQVIRFPKQVAVAASAAVVLATCGGMGSYTWSNPISYVSLDINPSIAYSLNEFNRVIAVSGMNDEGIAVVNEIEDSLKNVDITTALTITVEQLSTDAYLDTENPNYMIISVYSDKDSKASDLKSSVDAFSESTVETCCITTVNVTKETKETADSYGITAGKMELINEITETVTDPQEVDPAQLADMTVAELEQTKTVAASGASISEAVAAVTPDEEVPANTPAADPNAVASESKPSGDAAETVSAEKSETEEVSPASETTTNAPDDSTQAMPASEITDSTDATSTSNTVTPPSVDASSGTNSTDATGTGSSDKKNDSSEKNNSNNGNSGNNSNSNNNSNNGNNSNKDNNSNSSSSKGESSSSEKKNDTNSSSEKSESSSSDKKGSDKGNETQNSNTVEEDSSSQTNSNLELPPSDAPAVNDSDFVHQIVVCSILS